MTRPLGFDGNPDAWLTTGEVRTRMGYPSMDAWYRDAKRRAAAGFPEPKRRGIWRLGELQDWDRAGGFSKPPKIRPSAAANDLRPSHTAEAAHARPAPADAAAARILNRIERMRARG